MDAQAVCSTCHDWDVSDSVTAHHLETEIHVCVKLPFSAELVLHGMSKGSCRSLARLAHVLNLGFTLVHAEIIHDRPQGLHCRRLHRLQGLGESIVAGVHCPAQIPRDGRSVVEIPWKVRVYVLVAADDLWYDLADVFDRRRLRLFSAIVSCIQTSIIFSPRQH